MGKKKRKYNLFLLFWVIASIMYWFMITNMNETKELGQKASVTIALSILSGAIFSLIMAFFYVVIRKVLGLTIFKNKINHKNRKGEMPLNGVNPYVDTKLYNEEERFSTAHYDNGFSGERKESDIKGELKVPTMQKQELIVSLNKIPNDILDLLWIKGNENTLSEPSLIDLELEIDMDLTTFDYNEKIGYYPSYEKLSPKQRFAYLKWLEDVSKQVDIGYVFVFYYGLERHLLYGNFEKAYNMILKLRKYHKNKSFLTYSADAIFISILLNKKVELINRINLEEVTVNLAMLVTGTLTGRIMPEDIIGASRQFGFTNQRYIKSDYDLFKEKLVGRLKSNFGVEYYPIKNEDFKKCKSNFPMVIANYSLDLSERIVSAPDIITNIRIKEEILEILNQTHEEVKIAKREFGKIENRKE